jgi:polyvinyl alcohol dehydrogenase (cytochrome)
LKPTRANRVCRLSPALGAVLLGLIASLALAPTAIAKTTCSAPSSTGGEWPMYGHDVANTRSQPSERSIGTGAAPRLSASWVFSTARYGDASAFETTPVLAGGCVFIGSAAGTVYAVDAATGGLVWKRQLNAPDAGLGGAVVGAAAVTGGAVVWLVNESGGPYAIALSRATGAVLWRSAPVIDKPGYYTNASPLVANGLVAFGFSSAEGDPSGQGGFALLSAATGQLVKLTPTVPPADQAQGYAGGGLWSTPAYDPATGYLYWGSGNPNSKTKQDPNTDAILKIDLNRSDPAFGQIVAAYPGNVDQYASTLQTISQTPACAASDNSGVPYPLDDPVCGQLDLDFGAAANLFTDSAGAELVGDLQKAGVYHVAHADTMAPAWTANVGGPCQACNAASPAFDGGAIEGVSTPGGTMFSLGRDSGAVNWLSPVADGLHYESISVADGVAYTVDNDGFLDAFDAATGTPLLRRQLTADTGSPTGGGLTSNGVAVAEHGVFVAATAAASSAPSTGGGGGGGTAAPGAGAYLIAYRPPASTISGSRRRARIPTRIARR